MASKWAAVTWLPASVGYRFKFTFSQHFFFFCLGKSLPTFGLWPTTWESLHKVAHLNAYLRFWQLEKTWRSTLATSSGCSRSSPPSLYPPTALKSHMGPWAIWNRTRTVIMICWRSCHRFYSGPRLTWAWAALTIWIHLVSDLEASRELLMQSWTACFAFICLFSVLCWIYKCLAASCTKSSSCRKCW